MQIARELRLRDIGGIIIVDFIDMSDDCEYDFRYYLITDVTTECSSFSMCAFGANVLIIYIS